MTRPLSKPPYGDDRMEVLVDGMRELIIRNLIANTVLIQDAHAGDTFLTVSNTMRFERGEEIVIMDDNSIWDNQSGQNVGMEFNTIANDIEQTTFIQLEKPLTKDYLLLNHGRIQKALRNAVLYPQDVYYGDRNVLTFDQVAITVEPESRKGDWIALEGLLSVEYRMGIMLYVKANDDNVDASPQRILHAYADALYRLLIGNIHLDLSVDEVPLVFDARAGDTSVFIPLSEASKWQPSYIWEKCYEVQDNNWMDYALSIVDNNTNTSSSESSGLLGPSPLHSEPSSHSDGLSSSSHSSGSSNSSQSWTSSASSSSSTSSQSSYEYYEVFLSRPLDHNFRVSDKAVLRRKKRYFYDSRPENIEYGSMQKGNVMLKAAKLSWYGKETHEIPLPQIEKGGKVY